MRLFIILILMASSVAGAEENPKGSNLLESAKALREQARKMGERLFKNMVANDLVAITEMHISQGDLKSQVQHDAYDYARILREAKNLKIEDLRKIDEARFEKISKRYRSRVKERYGRMIAAMKSEGVSIKSAKYVDTELAELYLRNKEGFSMAADINIVVSVGEEIYRIQLDDCTVTERGWVLVDGFRWNPSLK